jgi:hypothetical protein
LGAIKRVTFDINLKCETPAFIYNIEEIKVTDIAGRAIVPWPSYNRVKKINVTVMLKVTKVKSDI